MALFSLFLKADTTPRRYSRRPMNWLRQSINLFLADRAKTRDVHILGVAEPLKEGEVALVGAGPGAPELLTLAALQMLNEADVVVYDRLVSSEILNLIHSDCQRICVGKAASYHSVPQSRINEILIERSAAGLRVVRLKGGDSFIFGRGGEELEQLARSGVKFRVVPGITAASGCTTYAGIPLTHRDYSQAVTFVTGHCKKDGKSPDWASLVASNHTLVVYMGRLAASQIQQSLKEHGMSERMPVAVIENGSRHNQRVLCGHLSQLSRLAEQAASPALLVIGEVVKLSEELSWFNFADQKNLAASALNHLDNE
ncbi:uroporphyrinogen-III C-methyltransferase [Celerinatantimonas diazotrophica]|uniref:uroporphyrinogen-III C-methyltransferase n=1 Tax=Celerinatantimonas diazotrophica TaxID=412034 RepID=A0A4R1J930_9GAMM|nr:uroporphyrinogen-III C-methyltransferase [Celerinatantimonas diazotrophica]TCK46894.1 uroporphyrin-III C-methyltransferase [Celerinatantimonas diazotrophica]CAG9295661.1 Siroheme synthase [Celerinatantimonas diazotrophica]